MSGILQSEYSDWATFASACETECRENFHVFNNICVECAEGTTRAGGDPIDGPNTFCAEINATESSNNNSLVMIGVAVIIAMLCVLVVVFFIVRRIRKKQETKLKEREIQPKTSATDLKWLRSRMTNLQRTISALQRVGFFNGKT